MKTLLTTVLILFSFLAVQSQVSIDVIGAGVYNVQEHTLMIPDLATVDQVVVEAIYKSKVPFAGKQVKFYDTDDTFFADLVPVEEELNFHWIKDDYLGYAQATFPGALLGPEGITLDQLTTLGSIHSFIAYIYRSDPGAGKYSVADFTHVYMFHNDVANAYVYDIPITTATDLRDVTTKVSISEMSADLRRCIIQVSDGYQTEEVTINTWDPLLGDALNIEAITLYDVPGDVTNITVTIYSPPYNNGAPDRGDSFITGAVIVDVDDIPPPPPGEYCTLSQGFYGNAGGYYNGYSTYALLEMLLYEPLVIGHPDGHRFIAHTPGCILQRLPGGGPSKALTGSALNCEAIGFQTLPGGRIKNALLAQTITLGLNLRLDTQLGDVALADLPFGYYDYFTNFLGADATIADLFAEANLVLSGNNQYGLNLGTLNDGVSKITEYFHDCQPLFPDKKGISSFESSAVYYSDIAVYPNPVASHATIEFTTQNSDYTTVELYNLLGAKVQTLYQGYTNVDETNFAYLNATGLNKGVYIIIVKNGDSVQREKITIN